MAGDDRAVAEWERSLGGTVTIDDGKERAIGGAKELPEGLWKLRQIDLHDKEQVDDASPKRLAGLTNVWLLNLHATMVTDAGLSALARLTNLQHLHLDGTNATDAGLKQLAAFKSLVFLNLNHTKVTDAGLKVLAAFKSLKEVHRTDTDVTPEGMSELCKALPNCTVVGDPVKP